MRDITFGITSFERPELLSNLVQSILKRYPLAQIVVADNGRRHARLPDRVKHLILPFDCGLSSARNALVDQLQTKYLLILEDDFLFTQETLIEPLLEVLESDETIGAVGGALRTVHGRVSAYALDIEVFRETMYVREATHRLYFTPSGVAYRLCDMIWNFALFRREMLEDHRWIDRLKVGEHCPYFHQVKLAGRWRIAACTATRIYHVPEHRSPDYLKYRRRAQAMFEGYLAEYGIKQYHRVLPYHFEDDATDKPPVLILGVGHSGTTILSKMLMQLGWSGGDADEEFGESVSIRKLNQVIEATGKLPKAKALELIHSMPKPWVLKDPRFVQTLHHWLPLFQTLETKPLLLRIRRNRADMLNSYSRRRSPGDFQYRIDRQLVECQEQYDRWPWIRLSIDYELIANAVAQFDLNRSAPAQHSPRPARPAYGSSIELDSRDHSPLVTVLMQALSITKDSRSGHESVLACLSEYFLANDSSNVSQFQELLACVSIQRDSTVGKDTLDQLLHCLGIESDSHFYALMDDIRCKLKHYDCGQPESGDGSS